VENRIYADDLVYLVIAAVHSISREDLYKACVKASKRLPALQSVFHFSDHYYNKEIEQALSNLLASNMVYVRSDKPDVYYDAVDTFI